MVSSFSYDPTKSRSQIRGRQMADLTDRVGTLETRVDEVEVEVRHSTDLGVTATREARTAREAHQRNIGLLNALRETQADHSRIFAEHSRILAEHSRMHTQHTARFDAIDGTLGRLTLGMHTIESLLRGMIEE